MRKITRFTCLAAALLATFASYAAGGGIEISAAWTRATAPGQDQAGVDLTILSKQAGTLVGVSSPVAQTSSLHSMKTEGGMMRMREVQAIDLPAGRQMNLGKSGYHLMLEGLKAPLREGEIVPLTLSIKVGKQGVVKIETNAEVRSLTGTNAASHDNEHQHMQMN